jgi:DNA polymerase-3 subunit delta'
MQVEKYLKTYQPVIYKTFLNSLQNERLSHAYLLCGNPGTPLLEVAKFLANSIICDNPSPLACDNCITCMRVDDGNYPDFIVYDGSKATIKKDEVASVETQFEKTAFETKGIMIYILHLIENVTEQAINSILKFLEEPGKNVYAFLTTNNENSILPTIISRCQVMHLKLVDRNEVIAAAIENGVAQDDAELLSYFYNDADLISEILADEDENDSYQAGKEAFVNFMQELSKDDPREVIYFAQTNIVPLVKTKESARFFIDMLTQGFKDILSIKNGDSPILQSYATMLTELANKLTDVQGILIELLKDRNIINMNINVTLLIDHLVLHIIKE